MNTYNQHPISHDGGKPDFRYKITREWTGESKPQFVVRFCDDWVGCSQFYSAALLLAVSHNCQRKGSPVIAGKAA